MRPEYIDAVNAVRWGWSLWAVFVVPATLLWTTAFFRRRLLAVRAASFFAACFLFWAIVIFHVNHIQNTKYNHMQTVAEEEDWSRDTWKVFAPITAIPYAIVYCTINAALAYLVARVFR
jgi:hypothetical protein